MGSENLTMKDALKGMKEQAARMAIEAQQAAEAAAAERRRADSDLANVNAELEAERKRISSLQVWLFSMMHLCWSKANSLAPYSSACIQLGFPQMVSEVQHHMPRILKLIHMSIPCICMHPPWNPTYAA